MKRILSVLTAALMVTTLISGCTPAGSSSSSSSGSSSASKEVTGTVKLKIAHNMDFVTIPDAVIEAGKRLNAKYAAAGRDLKIEFESDYQRIDWGEYQQNVMFAEKNGDGPDIFSLSSDVYGLVKANMLLDISEMVTTDFVDGIFKPYTIDGKAYGMPFDLPVRVIYFNKKALAQIGWTSEQIAALPRQIADGSYTFEQFMDLCKEVQTKGAAKFGMTHRPGGGADFLDILQTLGGQYYDESGKLVFDEAGIKRFFEFIYDNANVSKITPTDLNQSGWPTINKMVGDGTSFAYYGPIYSATYVASAVEKTPEQFVEDVAFVVFPASKYSKKPFCTAAPQGMGINANTKYPEICKDLFKELYAGESTDLLAKHASTIFTLSSVKKANDMESIKTNPILKEIGYMAPLSQTSPTVEGIATFTTEMHKQIVLLELGQATAEQATKDFKTQMELGVKAENIVFK